MYLFIYSTTYLLTPSLLSLSTSLAFILFSALSSLYLIPHSDSYLLTLSMNIYTYITFSLLPILSSFFFLSLSSPIMLFIPLVQVTALDRKSVSTTHSTAPGISKSDSDERKEVERVRERATRRSIVDNKYSSSKAASGKSPPPSSQPLSSSHSVTMGLSSSPSPSHPESSAVRVGDLTQNNQLPQRSGILALSDLSDSHTNISATVTAATITTGAHFGPSQPSSPSLNHDGRRGREVENAAYRVDGVKKENNVVMRQNTERATIIPVIPTNISTTPAAGTATAIPLNGFTKKDHEMMEEKNSILFSKKTQSGLRAIPEKEEKRETESLIHQGQYLGSMEDSDVESDSGQSCKPSTGFSLLDLIISETENDFREFNNVSSINQFTNSLKRNHITSDADSHESNLSMASDYKLRELTRRKSLESIPMNSDNEIQGLHSYIKMTPAALNRTKSLQGLNMNVRMDSRPIPSVFGPDPEERKKEKEARMKLLQSAIFGENDAGLSEKYTEER